MDLGYRAASVRHERERQREGEREGARARARRREREGSAGRAPNGAPRRGGSDADAEPPALPALPAGARLIGPLPSPMQRRAGKFRSQLILLAPDRRAAQLAADILVAEAESVPVRRGLKWSVDVDPQDLY